MPHASGMTLREETARAQSLGISLAQYRSLSAGERRRGASLVGTRTTRRLAGSTGTTGDVGDIPFPDFPAPSGGGATLTFAQTEAGQRLASALSLDTERFAGAERLRLEDTIHSLAVDLLPPKDVETAMRQVRRGELVKSKLAFQAVLQNLTDEASIAERRADIAAAEANERQTLTEARARITVDTIGRDVGRAIIFGLSTGGE